MPYCYFFAFLLLAATSSAQKQYDSLAGKTPQLKVMPNPVKNRAELDVQHFETGAVLVEIMNNNGIKVYSAERLVTGSADRITLLFRLVPGIYFCMVSQKGKKARAKMAVE